MKTLQSLTVALLILISFGALAKDSVGTTSMGPSKKTIAAPAFSWGSPSDLNTQTVERLRYLPIVAPALEWGTPEDLNEGELQALKVKTNVSLDMPAFNWGSVEDLDLQTVNALKTAAHTIGLPAVVIGDPSEIDASDLK